MNEFVTTSESRTVTAHEIFNNNYVNPREKERDYKRRSRRRTNFLRQEWRRKPETGNYTLRYRGEHFTIMKSKYDSGWGVMFRNKSEWKYNGRKIQDLETAKLVAFDMFDELHDCKKQYMKGQDMV